MSKSNTTENDLMLFIFNKTCPAWLGSLTTSGLTDFYLALYTDDPGEAGTAVTNEVSTGAYASYARVAVLRTGAGWTVSNNQASNTALVQFPKCTGGTGATISHVAVVTTASGAGQIIYSGALNDNLAVANLIQPQFESSQLVFLED
jgi:hypothetical protein